MALGSAIHSLLTSNATVSGLVSTRIYPQVMPGQTKLDAIAYAITDNDRNQSKDGASNNIKARFNISIWSTKYNTANTIAEAVFDVLDNYSGTNSGHTFIRMYMDSETDATWNEELGLHEIQQGYVATYQK